MTSPTDAGSFQTRCSVRSVPEKNASKQGLGVTPADRGQQRVRAQRARGHPARALGGDRDRVRRADDLACLGRHERRDDGDRVRAVGEVPAEQQAGRLVGMRAAFEVAEVAQHLTGDERSPPVLRDMLGVRVPVRHRAQKRQLDAAYAAAHSRGRGRRILARRGSHGCLPVPARRMRPSRATGGAGRNRPSAGVGSNARRMPLREPHPGGSSGTSGSGPAA